MLGHEDEALQTDAYIEMLLAAHGGRPVPVPALANGPAAGLRRTIRLIEQGLPRFHPSFLFEEELADRLRAAAVAGMQASDEDIVVAELIDLPAAAGGFNGAFAPGLFDRRLLLGGAIASGVSLAGAAVMAWRMRERGRARRRWLA